MMLAVAVDFDGVIHDYKEGWKDGSIYGDFVPYAVRALQELMARYAVFVFSTRNPEEIATWIQEKSGGKLACTTEIPVSGFWNDQTKILVTDRKLPAFAYIDDRAVPFLSWHQALRSLDRLERGTTPRSM